MTRNEQAIGNENESSRNLQILLGWTIKTKLSFVNLRRSTQDFYECRATDSTYGETIPARALDEETAYQETIARIKRMESE